MPRTIPRVVWAAVPMAYFLYLYGLSSVGLVGPDEPRYAAIAREMARSGDWITPRLWGEAWFEKPALLYWMGGLGFRLGLGPELAPRLPVALLSIAFLIFYWWILDREFGCRAAWISTLILGTSGAWIGFSQAAVTDLPLTATFSAAMLLALPWIGKGDACPLPAAGAMLGFAALAKGLLPLGLGVPLVMGLRSRPPWGRIALAGAAFLAVAMPWYLMCYLRNGRPFPNELFWKHHVERYFSGALMHGQPWWFYLEWLPVMLLPWSPLLLLVRASALRDRRRLFLLAWVLFDLLLLSTGVNKLPGYVLPLFPAVAALLGLALDEAANARPWLAGCALLLAVFPIAVQVLPAALVSGISRAPLPAFHWTWMAPVLLAALAWWLESSGRRLAAVFAVALGATAGVAYVKTAAAPELDHIASARALANEIAPHAGEVCVDSISRTLRYSLYYYAGGPLPECSDQPKPMRIVQPPGVPAEVIMPPTAGTVPR
jgi:4-amino-4-deoxy-L-arabinose transferase-like glycosyltransferase